MFVSPAPSRAMAEYSSTSKTLKSSSKNNANANAASSSSGQSSSLKSAAKNPAAAGAPVQKQAEMTPARGALSAPSGGDASSSSAPSSSLFGYVAVVKKNGQIGSKFPMVKHTCVFGRERTCDVAIQLPYISKTHCRLEVNENGTVDLVNLTKNGKTFLNGVALAADESIEVKHNDVIVVGDRSFHFEYRTYCMYVCVCCVVCSHTFCRLLLFASLSERRCFFHAVS